MVSTTKIVDLPWVFPIYQQIIQAFLAGYGHHALLIRSADNNGAEQFCFALAQWLLCEDKQSQEACGHCRQCQLFLHHSHPDFYFIHSEEGKKISVDTIREVADKLSRRSQQQTSKVVYLQGIEQLTEAAANALLKTLEEPTEDCYFILQTNVEHRVLATIQSRCQQWALPLPTMQQGIDWLQQQGFSDLEQMKTALLMNYQRPFAAKISLEKGEIAQRLAFLRQFWKFYRNKNLLILLPYFETEQSVTQINWLESFLLDTLKCSLHIYQNWLCRDLQSGIIAFAQAVPTLKIYRALLIVRQMRADLMSINGVNQELIITDGLIKMIEQVFEG
ncbi:DNA polymerase III subunit delta' [Gallibacterium genomosp. 2]|uniref:DNA polymerase III subunit delta' n=1 Tax=Gallibacterium genomosp. 2 TaxID=155517 RepID=A0A0A2XS59_9PAST|nr:DNA polymerase III subunit delta' [Gallibacterium genomosp. 2]KGQ33822.1 DNA polymerase III subunit delta' [Gallibacterium genomosp. 2]